MFLSPRLLKKKKKTTHRKARSENTPCDDVSTPPTPAPSPPYPVDLSMSRSNSDNLRFTFSSSSHGDEEENSSDSLQKRSIEIEVDYWKERAKRAEKRAKRAEEQLGLYDSLWRKIDRVRARLYPEENNFPKFDGNSLFYRKPMNTNRNKNRRFTYSEGTSSYLRLPPLL